MKSVAVLEGFVCETWSPDELYVLLHCHLKVEKKKQKKPKTASLQ